MVVARVTQVSGLFNKQHFYNFLNLLYSTGGRMTSKASDQGWFYHAPPKPGQKERVYPPPPSQIPGLSDVSQLPPETPNGRIWLRESDSNYIRLAKQGGRPDLLVMRTPEPPSGEPVGYPRCEWYYDGASSSPTNSNAEQEPYQFMLPDYMVHMPSRKANNGGQTAAERSPYAHDTKTAYDREGCGNHANDKTVKLVEERAPGYGVRHEKQQLKQAKKMAATTSEQCEVPSLGGVGHRRPQDDEAQMKKLLSFSYSTDYEAQKMKWQDTEATKNKTNAIHSSAARSTTLSGGRPRGVNSSKKSTPVRQT